MAQAPAVSLGHRSVCPRPCAHGPDPKSPAVSAKAMDRGRPAPLCLAAGLLLLFLLSPWPLPIRMSSGWGTGGYEGFLTLALCLVIFISAALWGRLGPLHVAGTALSALLVSALVLAQFLGKKSSGPVSSGSGLSRPGPQIQRRVPGHHWKLRPVVSPISPWPACTSWGAYAVPSPSRVRLLYLSAGLAAWFTLLLSEVAAAPRRRSGLPNHLPAPVPGQGPGHPLWGDLCLPGLGGLWKVGFWGTSIRRAP